MRLVQVKWKENNLKLHLYQAATLGVPASGRLRWISTDAFLAKHVNARKL